MKRRDELSASASSEEMNELREALTTKDDVIASLKSDHENQLAALMEKQSSIQMQYAELECRSRMMLTSRLPSLSNKARPWNY